MDGFDRETRFSTPSTRICPDFIITDLPGFSFCDGHAKFTNGGIHALDAPSAATKKKSWNFSGAADNDVAGCRINTTRRNLGGD